MDSTQGVGLTVGKLAVIIMTYNEEENIAQALESVTGWANEIFILDSFSTDHTIEIARQYDCQIMQYPFENFAKQRNYALDHLLITCEWVFFLDADEWVPGELKQEITSYIAGSPNANGVYLNRRFLWMGCWIKRGYYPTWTLRLFRYGKGRCEERAVNEHIIIQGETDKLSNDYMHEDKKNVSEWIEKHNIRATLEAVELIKKDQEIVQSEVAAKLFGAQAERKRWVRHYVWERLPPLIRPLFYFFFRYIIKGGILDGKQAFTYHFLQALWFPMLIDIKYLEMKNKANKSDEK